MSYVDLTAPTGQQVYYAVRAETNGNGCSDGPNNGGLMDSNTATVAAIDTDQQPLPTDVDDLTVELINDVHVRLNWSSTPDTAQYNVNRSTGNAEPDQFILLGQTQSVVFDDEGSGANANTYFYLVNSANACGDEAP